MFYINKLVKC